MVIVVHTHLRLNNAYPRSPMGIRVFLAGIPWGVGVGAGLLAMVVYRLGLKAEFGWLWTWFLLWLALSAFFLVDFVHLLGNDFALVVNLVGFPGMMIMGMWLIVFLCLLIHRPHQYRKHMREGPFSGATGVSSIGTRSRRRRNQGDGILSGQPGCLRHPRHAVHGRYSRLRLRPAAKPGEQGGSKGNHGHDEKCQPQHVSKAPQLTRR